MATLLPLTRADIPKLRTRREVHRKGPRRARAARGYLNYYPKYLEPELTYGLQGHKDPNALIILLQDHTMSGLQILQQGSWSSINPLPNTFVINIGDQLHVLSNGRYRSVWNRAVVNASSKKTSITSHLCLCNSSTICHVEKLTENGIAYVYRSYICDEYYKKLW